MKNGEKKTLIKYVFIILCSIGIIYFLISVAYGKIEVQEPYTITGEVTSVNLDRHTVYANIKTNNGERHCFFGESNTSNLNRNIAFNNLISLTPGDNVSLTITTEKQTFWYSKEPYYHVYVTSVTFN